MTAASAAFPFAKALAPSGLGFYPAHLQFGDCVGAVMVLTAYPPRVGPAWLARITQLPDVIASIHVVPASNTEALIRHINQSIGELSSRVASAQSELQRQRAEQQLRDAQTVLRRIDQEQQQVFYLTVVLLVLAPTLEELARRKRRIEAVAAAAGMRARVALFCQEPGLRAAGPFADPAPEITMMGSRNMLADTVAAAYPWTSAGLNHGRGLALGRDPDGGLVLVDRWDPPDRTVTNGNLAVLGTSGGGKSYTTKLWLLREYARGARIIIVDPEREYRDLCRALGGDWIDLTGAGGRINPLQVPVPVAVEDDEDSDESVRGPLAAHMQRLQTFFALYQPDMSSLERARLEEALSAAYQDHGIDWHTDPATVTTWPTLRDVYNAARKVDPDGTLAARLRSAAEGADSALWEGQTTLRSNADVVVLDIHALVDAPDNVRRAQYFLAMAHAWDMVRQGRERGQRTILVVDEAWILVDPRTPQAIDFLRSVAKRIRKYGPGRIGSALWTVTQNVADLLADAVRQQGEALLGNASYKLLMLQGERDLEALTGLLRLSESEQDRLLQARQGEGLLIAGRQRVWLRVEASPWEHQLLTGGV